MPYPFVYQHPNPFTTPPWGPSSNDYRSRPPHAGPPWGGWQPSHSMNRPYLETSPWTAPSPLQPSPFLHNTPVPQPTFIQSSHPSPQGYQPSPQYISPSLPLSQAFLPSGSYSNNDCHATATSRPHTKRRSSFTSRRSTAKPLFWSSVSPTPP
ncbi:hypothetical protein CPB85DRAFT_1276505 [Mucidula mucida]|nr:hypothetical protein CPB85DRAFT_1276505 [Mucidula mucida]